jgi:multicomponent Na+:H+ antiporter subunit F
MNLKFLTLALVMPVWALAIVLAFVRLLRGPSLADRVIALDLMTAIGMGMIAAYGISADQPVFIDVAIVLTLVSFVGTIAFASYMERSKS